jgi:hypothetical protein
MDLNLAPGKETEGAREERVTTLPLPVVEQRFLSFGPRLVRRIGRKTLYQNSRSISFVFGKNYPNFD